MNLLRGVATWLARKARGLADDAGGSAEVFDESAGAAFTAGDASGVYPSAGLCSGCPVDRARELVAPEVLPALAGIADDAELRWAASGNGAVGADEYRRETEACFEGLRRTVQEVGWIVREFAASVCLKGGTHGQCESRVVRYHNLFPARASRENCRHGSGRYSSSPMPDARAAR